MSEILSDDIYLENIEEYVKDDRKIVTCKWLSRTLCVPMNTAKKMLYHYVSQHSQSVPLSIMYCITGRMKSINDDNNEDDRKSIQVKFVSDKELEATKKEYNQIWNVHVYSVHSSPIKDSCMLYSSDYQISRDNLSEYNKWNTISCDNVSCDKLSPRPRVEPIATCSVWSSEKSGEVQSVRTVVKTEPVFETHSKPQNKQTGKKNKNKLPARGTVSSFFNTKPSNNGTAKKLKTNNQTNPTAASNKVSKTTPTVQVSKPASNQVMASDEISDIPIKTESVTASGLRDSDFEDDVDECSDKPSVVQINKKTSKSCGNDKPSKTSNVNKKRRRVHRMSSDEDSDTAGKRDSEPIIDEKNTVKKSKIKPRKRERKLVTKMYTTDDGSMVTEKVYEDVSTDASSDEGKENEGNVLVVKNSLTNMGIQSPSKRTKQSTLTSFFKK